MDISTILSQIDLGSYAMPVFQRGYVWNRDQVRKLMNSLYHGYPIGELLVWNTTTDPDLSRGDGPLTPGNVNLILDGQQRMTTLYGVIRGKPPAFFEGNASAFTNLYFNVNEEIFEFYMAAKMKSDPAWISVTELMQKDASNFVEERVKAHPEDALFWMGCLGKLNRLYNITKTEIHIQTVSGPDKTIDVVVEIFNNVNSGGTKLSKGDLALAKICSDWPEARDQLKKTLQQFQHAGYSFSMEWLLRCLTVHLTGQPYFNALSQCPIEQVKKAVPETEKKIGDCLDYIGSRLGLDHDRVMGNAFPIVTMIGLLRYSGGKLSGSKEWDRLLYWYVHAVLWGRYSSSTESNLAQDLNAVNRGEGIDGLILLLKQSRGDLTIRPEDFWGWSTGARFYPLLYLLTRTGHARDWGTNLELRNSLLGKNSTLEVHHIFPKAVLYKNGKSKAIVNAIANYAFLTKDTNLEISDRHPDEYLPDYIVKSPGAVESHWMPMDPELWKIENYEAFLSERRKLLAKAANELLEGLNGGALPEIELVSYSTKVYQATDELEEEVVDVSAWMEENGLNAGVVNFKLLDEDGNEAAIIDLAWPQGIQSGLSERIALLINETPEVQAAVSRLGYRYFDDAEDFKKFVTSNYLA